MSDSQTGEYPVKPEAPIERIEFQPPWWLRSGHSQTLYRKFRAPQAINHRRQRIELHDGDFIDLDWSEAATAEDVTGGPVVLLIHGLCGCSSSPYIAAMQSRLNQHGLANVAMNLRGCSGEPNRLARSYHSGASADLEEVYGQLRDQNPGREFVIIGYSLGANILLKWLGESGSQGQLKMAVAVSTPFRLADCSRAMLSGFSRVYGRYFVNRLQADLQSKQNHLRSQQQQAQLQRLLDLDLPARYRNIWEFDDRVTAPLHGFADAGDYYARCSSEAYLSGIHNNTLLIQSADDPLIPGRVIPKLQNLGSGFELILTRHGGHVGFIAGRQADWLEETIYRHALA